MNKENLKKIIKKVFLSSKAKTFYWQTVIGFIGLMIIALNDVDWQYVPVILALLNGISKYINKDIITKLEDERKQQ